MKSLLQFEVFPKAFGRQKACLLTALLAVFVLILSFITYERYTKLPEYSDILPASILAHHSGAPFKYRILPALLYSGLNLLFPVPEIADLYLQVGSIVYCYVACFIFFYHASGSLHISALLLLALHGTLFGGHWYRFRSEFLETGFVVLLFVMLQKEGPP